MLFIYITVFEIALCVNVSWTIQNRPRRSVCFLTSYMLDLHFSSTNVRNLVTTLPQVHSWRMLQSSWAHNSLPPFPVAVSANLEIDLMTTWIILPRTDWMHCCLIDPNLNILHRTNYIFLKRSYRSIGSFIRNLSSQNPAALQFSKEIVQTKLTNSNSNVKSMLTSKRYSNGGGDTVALVFWNMQLLDRCLCVLE